MGINWIWHPPTSSLLIRTLLFDPCKVPTLALDIWRKFYAKLMSLRWIKWAKSILEDASHATLKRQINQITIQSWEHLHYYYIIINYCLAKQYQIYQSYNSDAVIEPQPIKVLSYGFEKTIKGRSASFTSVSNCQIQVLPTTRIENKKATLVTQLVTVHW